MKPGISRTHLPDAGQALQSQGGLQTVELLCGAERHRGELPTGPGLTCAPEQRHNAPATIGLDPAWGLQLGVGRGPPCLKKHFKQYFTLFQLFLDEL